MAYRSIQGIVLARTDYRENDRMITLLSPDFGRVDALCRGCRKPKSPLMTAGELFCMGEYVLYARGGRQIVTACTVIEAFYPLRLDYSRLSYGAMMLSAALKLAQPEEPAAYLYILLARSLKRLAYQDSPARQIGAAFLLHLAAIGGYKPRLNHCARCGRQIGEGEAGFLVPQEGGICCTACCAQEPIRHQISAPALHWLRQVLALGIDKAEAAPEDIPYARLAEYVAYQMDGQLLPVRDE
ncbi:MAG: DNA repair protein RecO [Eubacteriales bacterium]|nr:DNA repair protein RecO [Eubacteriales bacterium]